jgi:hypothetical protein
MDSPRSIQEAQADKVKLLKMVISPKAIFLLVLKLYLLLVWTEKPAISHLLLISNYIIYIDF